jgi:choline monooxygenase
VTYRFTDDDLQDLAIKVVTEAETIPARWFTSPDMHLTDREFILANSWQYVGHVSQLAKAGDYLVDEILGRPLLIVRNQEHEVVCLSNVCRHRGGPIATASGHARALRCTYHAWTYNLDGQLIGAPKFDGACNFKMQECRLPRYRIEAFQGFLFVNLSGDAPDLSAHLNGIIDTIKPIDLTAMRFFKRVAYPVKANWKVYVDNYMEGYHILPVHPGLAKILDVTGYKTAIDQHIVLQFGPLAGANNPYHTDGAAYYYQVFPNLMLNILPGRVQINSIVPIDADHCLTVFDFFYSETDPEKLAIKAKDDLAISDLVQQEDISICEQVQKGLKSGAYNKGRICPSEELGVWAFHNNLRRAYRRLLPVDRRPTS